MEYWEPTQKVLQGGIPLVRRPKLTATLLKKPPFRFLHDVISEVSRQTGFAKGLFNDNELISTNMKDKESKVKYLTKIIDCIGITLQASVPVRPLKIVAGLEPEQTNVFLQMLAAATVIDKRISEKAVARVLAGEKQPPPGHGGTEWIELLKEMMSPTDSSICVDSPHPSNSSHKEADIAARILSDPTKGELEQDNKVESENGASHSPRKVPTQNLEGSSSTTCERKNEDSHISVKASKPVGVGNVDGSSHNGPEILDKQESQSKSASQSNSKTISNQSQQKSCMSPHSQKSTSKDSTPTKRRQSKIGSVSSEITTATHKMQHDEQKLGCTEPVSLLIPSGEKLCNKEEIAHLGASSEDPGVQMLKNEGDTVYSERQLSLRNEVQPVNQTESSMTYSTAGSTPSNETLITTEIPRPMTPCKASIPSNIEARPQSARKAPPNFRNNIDKGGSKFLQGMTLERPASAKLTARGESQKKPNILLDTKMNDDDDYESMPILLPPQNIQETVLPPIEGVGKLVRDILENKEDIEDHKSPSNGEETGIILGSLTRRSSSKKHDMQTREAEIQSLREAIQLLCRTANPLAKTMDALQEDVEVMNKEYHFWIKERENYQIKLEEERRITEQMFQAESQNEFEIEEEIRKKSQLINTLKAQVLKNDESISRSLKNLTTRSTRWISLPFGRMEQGQIQDINYK